MLNFLIQKSNLESNVRDLREKCETEQRSIGELKAQITNREQSVQVMNSEGLDHQHKEVNIGFVSQEYTNLHNVHIKLTHVNGSNDS